MSLVIKNGHVIDPASGLNEVRDVLVDMGGDRPNRRGPRRR